MTEGKSRFKLVVYAILIVILFFALIRIFAYGSGMFFNLELLGFIVLLLLSIIGFIGYVSSWGERVLFFVFLFYIANLVLLWYFQGSLYVVLLFLSLVGFLMSLPKMTSAAAQAIGRRQAGGAGPLTSVGELLTGNMVTEEQFKAMAERVSVRSCVFEIRSVGITRWGIRREIVAVVDRGAAPIAILYWCQSE